MELLRPILSMALVFALLGAALWLLRRNGLGAAGGRRRRRNPGRLEPIDRLALSPQHTLHLIRVDDRAVLIAAHPGGCTVLDRLSGESARASAPPEEIA